LCFPIVWAFNDIGILHQQLGYSKHLSEALSDINNQRSLWETTKKTDEVPILLPLRVQVRLKILEGNGYFYNYPENYLLALKCYVDGLEIFYTRDKSLHKGRHRECFMTKVLLLHEIASAIHHILQGNAYQYYSTADKQELNHILKKLQNYLPYWGINFYSLTFITRNEIQENKLLKKQMQIILKYLINHMVTYTEFENREPEHSYCWYKMLSGGSIDKEEINNRILINENQKLIEHCQKLINQCNEKENSSRGITQISYYQFLINVIQRRIIPETKNRNLDLIEQDQITIDQNLLPIFNNNQESINKFRDEYKNMIVEHLKVKGNTIKALIKKRKSDFIKKSSQNDVINTQTVIKSQRIINENQKTINRNQKISNPKQRYLTTFFGMLDVLDIEGMPLLELMSKIYSTFDYNKKNVKVRAFFSFRYFIRSVYERLKITRLLIGKSQKIQLNGKREKAIKSLQFFRIGYIKLKYMTISLEYIYNRITKKLFKIQYDPTDFWWFLITFYTLSLLTTNIRNLIKKYQKMNIRELEFNRYYIGYIQDINDRFMDLIDELEKNTYNLTDPHKDHPEIKDQTTIRLAPVYELLGDIEQLKIDFEEVSGKKPSIEYFDIVLSNYSRSSDSYFRISSHNLYEKIQEKITIVKNKMQELSL
jgi:hypothetical protein